MKEIQAKPSPRKSDYLIFPKEIESDQSLRFSSFRKYLHVYESKSYVLLLI
jgi:hypothetical protein